MSIWVKSARLCSHTPQKQSISPPPPTKLSRTYMFICFGPGAEGAENAELPIITGLTKAGYCKNYLTLVKASSKPPGPTVAEILRPDRMPDLLNLGPMLLRGPCAQCCLRWHWTGPRRPRASPYLALGLGDYACSALVLVLVLFCIGATFSYFHFSYFAVSPPTLTVLLQGVFIALGPVLPGGSGDRQSPRLSHDPN